MIITSMWAIIYFFSLIDFIADFIPGIGYIDDVFVISQVIKKLHEELHDFKVWRDQKLESKIKEEVENQGFNIDDQELGYN